MNREHELAAGTSERRLAPRVWFVFLLKAFVTVGLISWLAMSGSLDMASLGVLLHSPKILAATLGTWLVTAGLLSALRWRLLLTMVGVQLPLGRAVALQAMGHFFNGVVPGNVGGDVLKNIHVQRSLPREERGHVVLVVLSERLAGLAGLVWVAALSVIFGGMNLHEQARSLVGGLGVLAVGFALLPTVGPYLVTRLAPVERATWPSWLRRALALARSSLEVLQRGKRQLLGAFLLSMGMHGIGMLLFALLTRELGNADAELSRVALVFPLGMLSLAVPISLAGMGVGHVAFQKLFEMVSLVNGATIFNVYIVGQIAPSIVGVVPYLLMRPKKPEALEAAPEVVAGSTQAP